MSQGSNPSRRQRLINRLMGTRLATRIWVVIGTVVSIFIGVFLGGLFSNWWEYNFFSRWHYFQPQISITLVVAYVIALIWRLYDIRNWGSEFNKADRIGLVRQSLVYIFTHALFGWLRWIFGAVFWKSQTWGQRAGRIFRTLVILVIGIWIFSSIPDIQMAFRFVVGAFFLVYLLYVIFIVLLLHFRGTSVSANKSGRLYASGFKSLLQMVSDEIVDARRIDQNQWTNVHRPLFFPNYGDLVVSLEHEKGGSFVLKGFPIDATMALIQAAVTASRASGAVKEASGQIAVEEALNSKGWEGNLRKRKP